jgi:signal transduction histidine kinase
MSTWALVSLLSAASGLAVALLAVTRGAGSRLGFPLALLGVNQFAWDAGGAGAFITGDPRYEVIGLVASPLFGPLALHFVLTFLGTRHLHRRVLWVAYAVFGAQSAAALVHGLGLVEAPGGSGGLSAALLVSSVPLAVTALVWVARHGLASPSALEQARSAVLFVALLTVVGFAFTDLLADMGLPILRMAILGSFAFNALLTLLVLGLGLFPPSASRLAALGQVGVIALFAVVAHVAFSQLFALRLGVLITASAAVALALAAAAVLVVRGTLQVRQGLARAAALGRFSAQMAHDLRNPLAAAKVGAEYLAEELRRHGTGKDVEDALKVVGQLDRLAAVIDRYQRLASMTPELQALDLNELIRRTLALSPLASPAVHVRLELAPGPLRVRADPDLLASAVENLVKNSLEAMPAGGTLTVATALDDRDRQHQALVSVADTGVGLDARAREQAFEPFFTTKATGSGLGLPFVREVARAHGGHARLSSREGSGTVVEISLPAQ